jgi:hypothetical protein
MSPVLEHPTHALAGRYRIERELGQGGTQQALVVTLNWFDQLRARRGR